MNVSESMHEILQAESRAIASIPYSTDYDKAIELIVNRVYRNGGKLITSGVGKAGHIALNIAATFTSTGIPSVFLHPTEAQHGDLGVLRQSDVLLLVSNSGSTHEITELVELSKNLYSDIPIIVITGNPNSPLARIASAALITAPDPEVCPLELTPTTSTTMMSVIGDILVVNVMRATGFTKADYALRHHGGYLGMKSRNLP